MDDMLWRYKTQANAKAGGQQEGRDWRQYSLSRARGDDEEDAHMEGLD